MAETLTDEQLLRELEPTVDRELERHLATAKPWYPHELIPYSRAQDFERGYVWEPEDSGVRLNQGTRSALIVNLLTEDNLPHYFNTISRMFGNDGPWGVWSKRWTAEEARHSDVISGYLRATRAVDPVLLEDNRMLQLSGGIVPQPNAAVDGIVYVALQELATRIAHRNTGERLKIEDPVGFEVMRRVAQDENLHHIFYRNLGTAALELDAAAMIRATERQLLNFEMPGTGIPKFDEYTGEISLEGIYGINEFHDLASTVINTHWRLFDRKGIDGETDKSLEKIERRLKVLGRLATRETELREESQAAGERV